MPRLQPTAASTPPPEPQRVSPRLVKPDLWLATAPLAFAVDAAVQRCPEALALAATHHRSPARQTAFLAGRVAAAAALQALGCAAAVPRGPDGAPQWPPGVVGSIAHDGVRAVAVVGSRAQWLALGVDVEPDEPLPDDAAALVLRAEDQLALQACFGENAWRYTRLVFCAKECVHKALYPWRGAWLEFDEVRVACAAAGVDAGSWQAHAVSASAQRALAGARCTGDWWRSDGALWSLLAVSRSGSPATGG